jgi:hypothetical protein
MTETYYAGAYWGDRQESAVECARRAENFFRLLSRCDSIYMRWFEKASTRKKALQLQFEPTQETFLHFFSKKKYQGVEGFRFGAWTGHEPGHGGMVSLTCGSSAESFCNVCLLSLPSEEPTSGRVLTAPMLVEVMLSLVLAWEPDWAVVTSDELRDMVAPGGEPDTFVGWVTYLSHRRGEVPLLPEPVRVEQVDRKGTLILLSPERLSATNPEHEALARRVQDILLASGLLKPIVSRDPPAS